MSNQFVISCDFDHTIHNPEDRAPGYRMGRPFPGARETLTRLHDLGAKIVIHTCRARSAHGQPDPDHAEYVGEGGHVEEWLRYFEIPFDEVTALKPIADCYLDDKALPFEGNWANAERELLALFYLGGRK